jgi:hypothetical protein
MNAEAGLQLITHWSEVINAYHDGGVQSFAGET